MYSNFLISNEVQFWLFLTAFIPSVGCSIFVLYHLISNRTQRHAINNRVIIVLISNNLIYELIDIPLFLNYYRLEAVWPNTPGLCLMWIFIDEALYSISTVVLAWASIERHILIFHNRWWSSTRRRRLIHFIPLVSLVFYIIIFHTVFILLPLCENTYDYTQELCGHKICLHNTKIVGTWDSIMNDILPTLIIVGFSIALLVRVLLQNRRVHQHIQWRKHRKMAIQLLSISILYSLLYIPIMCIVLAQLCCISQDSGDIFIQYGRFFSYYVTFLLPFVCFITLSKCSYKFKDMFPNWHRPARLIHPMPLPMMTVAAERPNIM
ncbi:unnamed protein product [Adineta ricciae]|uniref:G-protein coupled receptors family 1 profile domain-containing protein n=1 Tax=Adineta ricciae TaxID=249248 RepID=A0A815MHX5_ADIRI|nr:unnamed protein product [Adineta ricciae]CAF1459050.1 unnamed protein product [Adineta ricciae]